jgi:hypothetical protein
VFLPFVQSNSVLSHVQSDTLVQHGGWFVLVFAVGIVVGAVDSYASGKRREAWAVLQLGVVAALIVVGIASDKTLRTLHTVGTSGEAEASGDGTVVPLGIAVSVAGVGAALAILGGWVMRQSANLAPVEPEKVSKRCPDCAEKILAHARGCKHCGYRFDAAP